MFGWLSLLAEILIIGTGGAVRLTGSGLGCPTWPTCVGSSIVSTPEMGIHGLIEFANRTLTGLVGLLALAVVVVVWRYRKSRRDLFVLALLPVLGVVAQAIIGGITVLTGLNPFIVGFHYVASLVIVAICTAFLVRANSAPGPRVLAVPRPYAILTHLLSLFLAVTIFIGVLTTGAGPHSGDANVGRNGFDAWLLSHFHAWPAYLTFALASVLLAWSLRSERRMLRWQLALFGSIVVQILVGLVQANSGLPVLLVGIHMVLAAIMAALMTVVVLTLKTPIASELDELVSAALRA